MAGGVRQGGRVFASGSLFDSFENVSQLGQVFLDAANNLLVNVIEVEDGHPLFAQVLTQSLRVERKLKENMHLGRLLGHYQFAEVHDL